MMSMIDPGLRGKGVLVTGANNPRGIGAAAGKAFARLGCRVFLTYFREPAPPGRQPEVPGEELYRWLNARTADDVVEEIKKAGGTADSWEANLADPGLIPQLLDRAERAVGPVSVLVNNAAGFGWDTFLPTGRGVYEADPSYQASPLTPASYEANFAVNSRASALLMAEFARRIIASASGWGRIINISTDASASHPGAVSYGASKHALESYSRSAAMELARYGITVNVIAPGAIQTGWISPALEARLAKDFPLSRVGTPEDIAGVVAFLASEQARWVTGQTLYVGGGNVMPL
jgi:3-oxoacyl-[acyl-carrier protein] reductase